MYVYVYEIKRREKKSQILLRKEEGGLGKDPFALLTIARRYYPVLLIPAFSFSRIYRASYFP